MCNCNKRIMFQMDSSEKWAGYLSRLLSAIAVAVLLWVQCVYSIYSCEEIVVEDAVVSFDNWAN